MTIGISKERLIEIAKQTHDSDDTNHIVLSMFDFLIRECKELNPWLPVDENTPKDRPILLFYPEFSQVAGQWSEEENKWILSLCFYLETEPTRWCELPEDPRD